MLPRLGLDDLLVSEKKNLDESATLPIENPDSDPFAFRKGSENRDMHIAQTQRILANIQRQNQEKSRLFEDEESGIGVKRKQTNAGRGRSSKKVKLCTETNNSSASSEEECYETGFVGRDRSLPASNNDIETIRITASPEATNVDRKDDSLFNEELPSVLGSPVTSSTQMGKGPPSVNTKLSIFQFSRGDDSEEDDTIFDL